MAPLKSCSGIQEARSGIGVTRVRGPFRRGLSIPASHHYRLQREFAEETGHHPDGDFISLGSARQPGGKVIHAWAVRSDWHPVKLQSNTFEMEWPPRSGQWRSFPELDRAAWFGVAEARMKILKSQAVFIDRLLECLG
jgi:predicted NUDIX family NTP pyrophosphohydrolase